MTRIELAPAVAEDFDRVLDHLSHYEVADAPARIEEILKGISVLGHNPLMGQLAHGELRELVIGRQSRGYIALYRYVSAIDTVFVLAIRSQREAGYKNIDV
ncbi:MAG: type II toxin-antitoxin system RelE/ParE family toxin [Nitrococcus sp.]|nr:type II toxin-antitoxin system RelE/ParE family toxin [Nitrococcus sp.]